MCNLRVVSSPNMVTPTRTPFQKLGKASSPTSPGQYYRGKPFNKSPSPSGTKVKNAKARTYPGTPTPKKVSVTRSHSSPMAMPTRATSSPQGRGSGYGSPQPSTSFAGSKCFEPPMASSLPKPPSDWFNSVRDENSCDQIDSDICQQLMFLLKVHA